VGQEAVEIGAVVADCMTELEEARAAAVQAAVGQAQGVTATIASISGACASSAAVRIPRGRQNLEQNDQLCAIIFGAGQMISFMCRVGGAFGWSSVPRTPRRQYAGSLRF
jgi:hypothetical protein